jgi:peptidoglycan hydrolase-like protein with peptidoglycan-binding domain
MAFNNSRTCFWKCHRDGDQLAAVKGVLPVHSQRVVPLFSINASRSCNFATLQAARTLRFSRCMAILRTGSRGAAVSEVQSALGRSGHAVRVDGRYGRDTREAVRAFQREHHLAVDGRVGPRTAAALGLHVDAFEPAPARRGSPPRSSGAETTSSTTPPREGGGGGRASAASEPSATEAPRPLLPTRMSADELENRTATLSRLADRIDALRASGRSVPPELAGHLREVLRHNPDVPRGTPLHFGSPITEYYEGRSHLIESARRIGIALE